MHQSKRAVNVQDVIAVLCKLLTAAGLASVPPPDVFRRAKFNRGPEVEDPFWGLLANILQKSNIICVEAGAYDNRKLVAVGLWQSGYYVDWTRCVGEGGEQEQDKVSAGCVPSGRDLLLALGWLLATGTLERMMAGRAQQLDCTLLEHASVIRPNMHVTQLDHASLRRLHWLIGCLKFQRRSLLAMQEERGRLMHMVLSASIPSSPSTSTCHSNHKSSALQEDCVRIQELCSLLEAYVNWRHTETLFWAWMDSVVDCHVTEKKEACPDHHPASPSSNRSRVVCLHGNLGLETLNNMLFGLPTVKRGERRGKQEPSGEQQVEAAHLKGRDGRTGTQEMFQKSSPLCQLLSKHVSPTPLPRAYRVRLQGARRMQGGSGLPAEEADDRAPPGGKLQASQASWLLLRTEALLLERKDRSREAKRAQLQEMIGRLEELVLIPP